MLTVFDVDFYDVILTDSENTKFYHESIFDIPQTNIIFCWFAGYFHKNSKPLKGLVSTHPSGWGCLYLVAHPS